MAEKYFWLKLQKDFFKRHDIQIIEDMENGKDYILFYLKLLCESVSHNGNLRFSDTIPYNDKMLATITHTDIDKVRSAIKVFTDLQMMEVLKDGTIYLAECQKMLGSECNSAERVRRHRLMLKEQEMLHCNDNVTNGNTQVTKSNIDIDIEKDIDNKLVNNIKNKNENIYSIAHEYMCKERTEEERESCRSRWSEFFRYCCTDKYINASNRVLDTILNARDLITEHGLLAFNSKNYEMEDFETILDKIDDDKFRQITQSVALEENIESNFYIIGSLIKASEQK
jgi:predicted phage replisome organizer